MSDRPIHRESSQVENRPKLAAKNQEQQLLQRLLQLPIFAQMTAPQMQVLLKVSRSLALEPGESLWLEGDSPRSLYLLLKGELSIVEEGREVGHVQPVASLGEGPLLAGFAHDDEVTACSSCLFLELPGEVLEVLFKRSSDICQRICRNVVNVLSQRLQQANDRMSDIARRRTELEEDIREAEIRFNDLSIIQRMRA